MKNLEIVFDCSNLDGKHELFNNKNKKVVGNFKLETSKSFWIEKVIALRSKTCSFKRNDKITNKKKNISKSQSKNA